MTIFRISYKAEYFCGLIRAGSFSAELNSIDDAKMNAMPLALLDIEENEDIEDYEVLDNVKSILVTVKESK